MFLTKLLPKTAILSKQESSKESVTPGKYLYFDVVVGLVWSDHPESYVGGSVTTGRASHAGQVSVSCAVPVGNVSWMLFQEGRSSNLRRGVGHAAHTRNNPHVKCTGVIVHKQRTMLIQMNCIEFSSRDLGSLH